MVIFMTSSSLSKTEFTCIFYDVFDVGGYVGYSLLEVSLLYILGIPPLPLLTSLLDATHRHLSNKLEFAQFGAHMQKLWQFRLYCILCFLCCVPESLKRKYCS